MIKAVLVLRQQTIPANANFVSLNEHIDAQELKLEVVKQNVSLGEVDGELPIVGVNSFGFGGTNAHVVLQAAPHTGSPSAVNDFVIPRQSEQQRHPEQPLAIRPHLLPLSARDAESLRFMAKAYRKALSKLTEPLSDFCYSAGARRQHHAHRLVVVGDNAEQLKTNLTHFISSQSNDSGESSVGISWVQGEAIEGPVGSELVTSSATPLIDSLPLTMVFTGQGSQWTGMGRTLIQREPIVRETLAEINALFASHAGWSLIDAMMDDNADRIHRTIVAQPAIFAIQVALVRLWRSWGVEPDRVVGHSVGEVAAAWTVNALSLADAVKLVFHRSRLQDRTGGRGRMAVVGLTPQQVSPLLAEYAGQIAITAFNSASMLTIGGDTKPMESLVAELESRDVFVRWLKLDDAFHTHQMDGIETELMEAFDDLTPATGTIW